MAHLNRERVPRPIVHAEAYDPHLVFTVTHDISRHMRAKLLGQVGNTYPILSRSSTVGDESSSASVARDPGDVRHARASFVV